jgi:hypothetical protein
MAARHDGLMIGESDDGPKIRPTDETFFRRHIISWLVQKPYGVTDITTGAGRGGPDRKSSFPRIGNTIVGDPGNLRGKAYLWNRNSSLTYQIFLRTGKGLPRK